MRTNKIIHILFFSLLLPFGIHAQQDKHLPVTADISKLKKEISSIVKKKSMYRDSVDWARVTQESAALRFTANDSINKNILFDFFTKKLRAAGDKHSFFISKKSISKILETPIHEKPEADYLGEGIGWVKVPECLTFDAEKDRSFANTIRSEIKRIGSARNILGWIVDLRHNGGGNMWPMLAGLNALSEDGTLGYFVDPRSKKQQPWTIQNGKLFSSTINSYKIKNTKIKIAVLIDSLTGSSGEMTAISFMGLPNVKVFGQPSAGYTTANNSYFLSDGSQLLLAERFSADRTGKAYKDRVMPDVNVNDSANTKNDAVVSEAKKWLLK